MSLLDAQQVAMDQGLVPSLSFETTDESDSGIVIDQHPEPGETNEAGSPVQLTVAGPPPEVLIRYEVQEDERLLAIAENFGTTRPRIIRANEGMADRQPYVVAGDEILVPASAAMTVEELEAIPGYLGPTV